MTKPSTIKTRRSCIGCGMRPGALYSNGLCPSCQYPDDRPSCCTASSTTCTGHDGAQL